MRNVQFQSGKQTKRNEVRLWDTGASMCTGMRAPNITNCCQMMMHKSTIRISKYQS